METNTAPRSEPPTFGDQIPVDPDHATLIWFEQTFNSRKCEITRVLATGTLQGSSYQQKTESWYMGSSALTASASVTMTSSETKEVTQVQEFIAGATAVIVADQKEKKDNWVVWATGDNSTGTLFQAPDPDNSKGYIGLYLEFDTSGQLASVAWYRTQLLSGGTVFGTTPASLTFAPVHDASGAASTNPNDIATGTWQYSKVMPPR